MNSRTLVSDGIFELTQGIGAADILKLKSAGICTVYVLSLFRIAAKCHLKAVQATTKRNLSKIKGLSETKVDKIKEASCKIFVWSIITSNLIQACQFYHWS